MNILNYIDAISCLQIFNGVDKKQLLRVFNTHKYEMKQYSKNQIVHLQSEVCNAMDIILEGQVSVQNIDENGNVLTINTFSNMNIIGANLLFSTRNYYPMTVIAKTKAAILHINSELILTLCQSNQLFMKNFLTILSDRTISLTDKINAISLKTIRQRLIDFLRYEYHIQKSSTLELRITKKNLAQRFGIQRSSLSREINKMQEDGLIEFDSKTITIKNMDLLKPNT